MDKLLLLNSPFYLSSGGDDPQGPQVVACLASIAAALVPGGTLFVVERHLSDDEESVRLDDDPAVRCAPLTGPWTALGLQVVEQRMVQADVAGTGAHCLVKLRKPAPAP